jgi:hypothetical protein
MKKLKILKRELLQWKKETIEWKKTRDGKQAEQEFSWFASLHI